MLPLVGKLGVGLKIMVLANIHSGLPRVVRGVLVPLEAVYVEVLKTRYRIWFRDTLNSLVVSLSIQ
jgi:hypothetical protein